ncbi:MAG: pyridoxamine 5'-phosphate oxidase family protein [Chloroflexi bacterium]|nr:pyridoxamine 5'-phosphate oxidase family protein [Chloroflexota bacterium]
MRIPDAVRDFLATGPLAHVVLRHADDRLHVTLSWVGVEGDEVVFSTFYSPHKVRDLMADPRVTLSFQANEHAGPGLWPYLVIDGVARVTEGGALPFMDRIAPAYLGPGAMFPARDAPAGWLFHVSVERIYGVGPWRESEAG